MSNKIKSIIEAIGVVVSVIILILLLFILALYVGSKFNLLKDYPVVIAGFFAALIAFLGVVVSQLWQSSNTNKNIKATQENLEKQLDKQQETLNQQFTEQRNLLIKQNEHALKLEEIKLYSSRVDKRYEMFEVDKKDFYFQVIELSRIIERLFTCRLLSAHALIHINIYTHMPRVVRNPKEFEEYQQESNKALDNEEELRKEYNHCFTMLKYLHDIKSMGDRHIFEEYCNKLRGLESLDKDVNEVIDDSKKDDIINTEGGYMALYDGKAAKFYEKIKLIKKRFTEIHQGEFYDLQKALLDNIQKQIVEIE